MSKKDMKIAALIASFQGRGLDAHYLAFFECFNQELFFEAHEVLEELWLGQRRGLNGDFYGGLIQLAGAFVHLQKNRLRPAAALLKLAQANLQRYPATHECLQVNGVLAMIDYWLARLEAGKFAVNPQTASNSPKLSLTATCA